MFLLKSLDGFYKMFVHLHFKRIETAKSWKLIFKYPPYNILKIEIVYHVGVTQM